jgi:hypothetical protein
VDELAITVEFLMTIDPIVESMLFDAVVPVLIPDPMPEPPSK